MAYSTSNAQNVNDLLDRFRLFLIANGWTVDAWADAGGTDGGKFLHVSRAGFYYTLASIPLDSAGPSIRIHLNTGYAGNPANAQPGASPAAFTNQLTGPMQAYHFFAGVGPRGPYAYAVVETDPGEFKHFGLGVLVTMGVIANGAFAYGSHWGYDWQVIGEANSGWHGYPFDDGGAVSLGRVTTILRADYSGISPRYHFLAEGTFQGGQQGRGGWRAQAEERSTIRLPTLCASSVQTGRAPLLPLWAAVDRGSGLWSDVGYPPDMRFVRIDNMEPGEEMALGTDTWMVFPAHRKNAPAGLPNSGVWGYAYRKTP